MFQTIQPTAKASKAAATAPPATVKRWRLCSKVMNAVTAALM